MASYNYVDPVNTNLVCCICRVPFTDPVTTRTCFHTFCRECIVRAIGHSPQCPVDRSFLALDDLLPANPIVRSLVDELIVECVHSCSGCTHTCQRQLLAAHLTNSCLYREKACPEPICQLPILRKDTANHTCRTVLCETCHATVKINDDAHRQQCSMRTICEFCMLELSPADVAAHNGSCPDFIMPCTHAPNGCPWKGPRALSSSHLTCCPYEAISGFFSVNESRMAQLTDDNLVLRHKVVTLENIVQTMKREMQTVKTALGPWYRPDGSYTYRSSSELPLDIQPASASTSRQLNFLHIPGSLPHLPFDANNPLSATASPLPDVLAPYFPSEVEETAPTSSRPSLDFTPTTARRPTHRTSLSTSHMFTLNAHPPNLGMIAPLDLSTTLEGSLAGLRESVVTLGSAVDSLGRRNDIALHNETLRLNEEIMSLRANVQGVRMQIHAMMVDRNAQVTGRVDPPQGEGSWPAPARFYHPPAMSNTQSITKL